jgi:hypothetical protein
MTALFAETAVYRWLMPSYPQNLGFSFKCYPPIQANSGANIENLDFYPLLTLVRYREQPGHVTTSLMTPTKDTTQTTQEPLTRPYSTDSSHQ